MGERPPLHEPWPLMTAPDAGKNNGNMMDVDI
jgi:hypothetical protein